MTAPDRLMSTFCGLRSLVRGGVRVRVRVGVRIRGGVRVRVRVASSAR